MCHTEQKVFWRLLKGKSAFENITDMGNGIEMFDGTAYGVSFTLFFLLPLTLRLMYFLNFLTDENCKLHN